jgi:hypothetical protein
LPMSVTWGMAAFLAAGMRPIRGLYNPNVLLGAQYRAANCPPPASMQCKISVAQFAA